MSFASVATPALAETQEERAARQEEEKRLGSLYLRCDGQPNNTTDMEAFGRFVGAITLLGIFAPTPESPNPAKRLFGAKGVDACSQLLDDPKQETNGLRRIPLILARAAHHIEDKQYEAAMADVTKARSEASAIGLVGNAYFDRSMGLSFDNLEAEILLRMNDAAGAQRVSLRRASIMPNSFVPMLFADDYGVFNRELTPEAESYLKQAGRFIPGNLGAYAARLEENGRFADAARQREALVAIIEGLGADDDDSLPYATAALAHALAGEPDEAKARASFARANLTARAAAGKPDDDAAKAVEVLDLHDIVIMAGEGRMAEARRNFAARSQWLTPSLGTVMEVNRRLRAGASEAELFGALSRTPDQLWQERRDTALATRIERDGNNKTLFSLIVPYAKIADFEARSKEVWRIEKSRMISKKPSDKSGRWTIYASGMRQTVYDAIVLHAALQARSRGKQGFSVIVITPKVGTYSLTAGTVRFLDKDENAEAGVLLLDADAVIAELG